MTQARNNYIYQLIGRINNKNRRVGKKEYQGTYYWQLNITCENKPQIEKIMAFPASLENQILWKKIENNDYLDKKYTFFCKNYRGSYRLIKWEELKEHG
jgi:ATP-dependent phosphoenolpyruvate carboxykinase